MAATLGLVLDCAEPDKLAEFWSAAIGYVTYCVWDQVRKLCINEAAPEPEAESDIGPPVIYNERAELIP